LSITWAHGKAPDYINLDEEVPVVWDPVYGTFNTTLLVPAGADFRSASINCYSGYEYIGSTSITIGDPRRPTATLAVSAASTVWVDSQAYPFQATVNTGTGQPISGANVVVKFFLTRTIDVGDDFAYMMWPPPEREELTGQFTAVTDSHGVASVAFRLENHLDTAPAGNGDSVRFEIEYVGPTGEVLQDQLHASVQVSLFSVTLRASSQYSSIPGLDMGLLVSVLDDENNEVKRPKVSIELFAADSEDGKAVHSCDVTIVNTQKPVCSDVRLPATGNYTVVATYIDPNTGVAVKKETPVGKSAELWRKNPLSSVTSTLNVVEEEVEKGKRAVVRFNNFFRGAKLLLSWGSEQAATRMQVDAKIGENEVTVPVRDAAGKLVDGCLYGCSVLAILSAPQQGEAFANVFLHEGLFLASKLDLGAPSVVSSTLWVNAPDLDREVDVVVSTSAESALPGSTVEITVGLSHPDTKQPQEGEVAIFVVDQAFLDV
jgi:hypothetical protein